MRVRLVYPVSASKAMKSGLKKLTIVPEKEEKSDLDDEISTFCLIDPGQLRPLDEALRDSTQGKGKLELMDLTETQNEGEGAELS